MEASSSIVDAPDARRAHLHGMWAAVAGSWGEHADYVDVRAASVTESMLAASRPQPGERVLELACGAGGAGIAAAGLVGPGRRGGALRRGRRDDLDRSVARRRASADQRERAGARPREHCRARRLLRRRPLPRGPHVRDRPGACCEGDPPRPASRRASGRRGLGSARAQPLARARLRRRLHPDRRARAPARCPGPFSLGDAGRVEAVLAGAGLSDVTVGEIPTPLRAGSFEEWWARTSSLAGPLTKILAALPEAGARALRARVQETVRPFTTASGAVEIPGLTLVASARRI